jgi:hypothetical protein
MTQPVEVTFSSYFEEPMPQNPDGKSALQMNDSKFRELTEDELAEMEADEPGTGMDAEEIEAFLGAEIAVEQSEDEQAVTAGAGQLWRSLKAKRQRRDDEGQFTDGPNVVGEAIPGLARTTFLNERAGQLAAKVNGGADLSGSDDPAERQLQAAMDSWTQFTHRSLEPEIKAALSDPEADTLGAAFLRAVASAPADSPALYRGMFDVDPGAIPREGHEMDLGPVAFSTDELVADGFTTHETRRPTPGRHQVMITVRPGSRSLQVDNGAGKAKGLRERVGMGRYRVVERRDTEGTHFAGTRSIRVPRTELVLEQIA